MDRDVRHRVEARLGRRGPDRRDAGGDGRLARVLVPDRHRIGAFGPGGGGSARRDRAEHREDDDPDNGANCRRRAKRKQGHEIPFRLALCRWYVRSTVCPGHTGRGLSWVFAPRSGPAGPSECPCGDNQVPDESALDGVAVALDDEEKRRVGLLLLGKGAVSAHRFDRPRAAGLDERQQHEKRCSVLGTSAPSRHTRYSLRIDLDRCSELEAIARRPGPRGPG